MAVKKVVRVSIAVSSNGASDSHIPMPYHFLRAIQEVGFG